MIPYQDNGRKKRPIVGREEQLHSMRQWGLAHAPYRLSVPMGQSFSFRLGNNDILNQLIVK